MGANQGAATMLDMRAFVSAHVDRSMKRIGFEPIDTREMGGRAIRRTYQSKRERFVIDFYAEGGNTEEATGLKVRRGEDGPLAATYVWKFSKTQPPLSRPGVTTPQMMQERFESDLRLLLDVLPEIRSKFA